MTLEKTVHVDPWDTFRMNEKRTCSAEPCISATNAYGNGHSPDKAPQPAANPEQSAPLWFGRGEKLTNADYRLIMSRLRDGWIPSHEMGMAILHDVAATIASQKTPTKTLLRLSRLLVIALTFDDRRMVDLSELPREHWPEAVRRLTRARLTEPEIAARLQVSRATVARIKRELRLGQHKDNQTSLIN